MCLRVCVLCVPGHDCEFWSRPVGSKFSYTSPLSEVDLVSPLGSVHLSYSSHFGNVGLLWTADAGISVISSPGKGSGGWEGTPGWALAALSAPRFAGPNLGFALEEKETLGRIHPLSQMMGMGMVA